MELTPNHIGAYAGRPAKIIELTVKSITFGDAQLTETITNLDSKVDKEFIQNLRDLADELEKHNTDVHNKVFPGFE